MRPVLIEERRKGMAQMKLAGRARRKTQDRFMASFWAVTSTGQTPCSLAALRLPLPDRQLDDERPVTASESMTRRRSTVPVVIETADDLGRAIRVLRRKCPVMRAIHDETGNPELRRRPGGLAGLARIVIGQQVSVASAAAIWARTEAAFRPFTAEVLLAAPDTVYREAGLSTGKVRTLKALAGAVAEGVLDFDELAGLDNVAIGEALTAVPGIGPWTSDVYIMFCLGRADAFPAGDLALQVALQAATGLEKRPTAAELLEYAERWKPHRLAAAHLLWAYYRVKRRPNSGVPL